MAMSHEQMALAHGSFCRVPRWPSAGADDGLTYPIQRRIIRFMLKGNEAEHKALGMQDKSSWFENDVSERFLRYVQIWTTSDRHSATKPSSDNQFELARLLESELRSFGVNDITLTEECYLIVRIPASAGYENVPSVGFLAHLDTAPDESGKNVSPRVHRNYSGGVIELEQGTRLDPAEFPALGQYHGQTIITSDGTTLLGADNKAGVSAIMTALRYLLENPEHGHGPFEVIFTSDEEVGRGTEALPLESLNSEFCYTIDGGDEGSIEYECFSAYSATVKFTGHVIHPGTARGRLVNAVTMSGTFLSMLPRNESPEATDGRFGFYCPVEARADFASAELHLLLRDFEMSELERRVEFLHSAARTVEQSFPGGKVEVDISAQYLNMRHAVEQRPEIIEAAANAVRATGMEPIFHSIRGGTDGARLSELGIPTPNIFCGAQNMHGRQEWVAARSMVRAAKTVVNILSELCAL